MERYRIIGQKALHFLWAFTLVALPLTSFPLIAKQINAVVAPLSALPVCLLVIIWLLPFLLHGGKLPLESLPYFVFLLAAIGASAAAMFLEIPVFKGKTFLGQEVRALVTLGIGAAFYLMFTAWPQDEHSLKRTLQWINIGGILLVLWTLLQAYYMLSSSPYADWATNIQKWLSVKPPYFQSRGQRVTGLTYEASWFAHQIAMLYFPLWLAATYERTSAFGFRILRLSVENILLPIGIAVFFLSSPRVSLVTFLFMILFLFVKLNIALTRKFVNQITSRYGAAWGKASQLARTSIGTIVSLFLLFSYLAAASGLLYLGSQRDWRLKLALSKPPNQAEIRGVLTLDENSLLDISARLAFLERMVYWITGWNIFNRHPWFGVGLGNAGFFFPDEVPAIGYASFEIRNYLYRGQAFPNIKSLWIRLLAETGLIGFTVFAAWLYILWRSARLSYQNRQPILKLVALAGICSLIALISEGFSIDSFALPYIWVWLGLISAAGRLHRKSLAPA